MRKTIRLAAAVIYARYSSASQTEQSIEGQLDVCKKYAQDNDLQIVDTYIDRAMTGKNDQRAAFQKFIVRQRKARNVGNRACICNRPFRQKFHWDSRQ